MKSPTDETLIRIRTTFLGKNGKRQTVVTFTLPSERFATLDAAGERIESSSWEEARIAHAQVVADRSGKPVKKNRRL